MLPRPITVIGAGGRMAGFAVMTDLINAFGGEKLEMASLWRCRAPPLRCGNARAVAH
jgi:hypothetical protein